MPRRRTAVIGQCDLFPDHAEDAALGGDLAADFDFAADQRVQEIGRRIERLRPERQIAEQLRQRCLARQADCADRARAVEHGQALQDVVDLIEPHREFDRWNSR